MDLHAGWMSGYIKYNNEVIGEVLFYLDKGEVPTWNKLYGTYISTPDNVLVEDTRTSYRRLEGIVSDSGTEKILAPASAEATVADGKILMLVTPNDLVGAATPEKCDPFAYVVSITDEQGMTKEHVMYTEEASFDIPAGMSGTLKIAVRSKSMYDNIEESEPITAEVRQGEGILPTPDVKVELIETGTGSGQYTYRYSLNNLDVYNKKYSGWQVKISLFGRYEILILDAKNPTGKLSIDYSEKWYQINAQAIGEDYQSSTLTSVPVYLPNYQPQIKVGTYNGNDRVKATTSISGSSLDDLKINVTLEGANTNIVETPTIYSCRTDWNMEERNFRKTECCVCKNRYDVSIQRKCSSDICKSSRLSAGCIEPEDSSLVFTVWSWTGLHLL